MSRKSLFDYQYIHFIIKTSFGGTTQAITRLSSPGELSTTAAAVGFALRRSFDCHASSPAVRPPQSFWRGARPYRNCNLTYFRMQKFSITRPDLGSSETREFSAVIFSHENVLLTEKKDSKENAFWPRLLMHGITFL